MRLWTFQCKDAWEKLQEYGVWYANFNYAQRLKLVDEDYIQEDFQTPYGVIDTMPIYCFASMGKYAHNLCLPTMFSQYNHFIGWMQFGLERMVMIELEVPESFILSSKKHTDWFVEYPDMPENTPKKDRWKYEQVVRRDEIELENHLQFARSIESDDVESLIPYISIEHVAAVRVFKPVKNKVAGYGTCKVETVYIGKEVPLWTVDIYCNGDSYPRLVKDGKLVTGDLNAAYWIRAEHGMICAYPYMNVGEIRDCCAEFVWDVIQSKLDSIGLKYKDAVSLTYQQLLDM